MNTIEVAAGDRYGRFTVLSEAEPAFKPSGVKVRVVFAKCDCGTQKTVRLASLRSGSTVSCGCYQGEVAAAIARSFRTTHGMSRTRAYLRWASMVRRCHNPNDPSYWRYGARGVTVCQEWRDSFEAFHAYVGEAPEGKSLDRWPNHAGNYEPGNVRWATPTQQARNTRRNHLHTMDGETRCLAEWCEITGERWTTVKKRIAAGREPFDRLRTRRKS